MKFNNNSALTLFLFVIAFSNASFGYDSLSATKQFSFSGYGSFECGQIVKGQNENITGYMENVWLQRMFTGWNVAVAFTSQSKVEIGVELEMYNEFPRIYNDGATKRLYFYPYLSKANYIHEFGQNDNPFLTLTVGYFPFKYNEDSKNLGEYLFRTGTYPQYITGDFDFPFARLAGMRLSNTFFDHFQQDLILFCNTQWLPLDYNVAYLASIDIARFFEFGAGASYNSLLSVDNNATMPKNTASAYIDNNGDTAYYTFAGIKVMARASLDFKRFFPCRYFGEKDCRLYGEAAILGVENYPQGIDTGLIDYTNIFRRIPMMLGFNLPTFKLLDVLSFEFERFYTKYPNDMQRIVFEGLPIPFRAGTTEADLVAYKNGVTKWSFYGTRSIGSRYKLTFQIASDHLRTFAQDWNRQDWEETLRKPDQWYYILKGAVYF